MGTGGALDEGPFVMVTGRVEPRPLETGTGRLTFDGVSSLSRSIALHNLLRCPSLTIPILFSWSLVTKESVVGVVRLFPSS